jgi:hypothetical protein
MSGKLGTTGSGDWCNRRYSAAPFTIAPHVRVCVTGDGSVLLDLKRDKYLGLGKEDTELLAIAIASWPKPRWDRTDRAPSAHAAAAHTDELCRSLAADGLLIPAPNNDSQACTEPLVDMNREWISVGDEFDVESKVTGGHVVSFVTAFLWARCSLAWRPFLRTVDAIRVEKAQCGGGVKQTHVLQMALLVSAFRQLRPFAFAAEGRCLLHALTLVKFLSRYGFYPECVIGVATQPWAAHAWVQWGNFLLDTNPEKVCRYTPIMVV